MENKEGKTDKKPTHASLFTGLGGFDLGAQNAGYENVFQVEVDLFCNRLLNKNFPLVKKYEDIREFDGTKYRGSIDVLSGGFPCQNISIAASQNRVGVDGDKSGLWREQLRITDEIRPRFAVIENSSAINGKGLSTILEAYSNIGYDAEWHRLEPKQFGLPQKRRQRTYIILYPIGFGDRLPEGKVLTGWDKFEYATWRDSEDRVYGVANGIPNRVDRHKAIGNSVPPMIPFVIFNAIKLAISNGK